MDGVGIGERVRRSNALDGVAYAEGALSKSFFATLQKVAEDHGNADHHSRRGVQNSLELKRILALPRRELPDVDLTSEFAKPGGSLRLRPIQSQALYEAREADGLFAPIAVGGGKTLIAQRAVILTKPDLKRQMIREREHFYGKHFRLTTAAVVSYNELSSAKSAGILDEIKPDLIIADEAHCLKRKEAARTKRFRRYMKQNPGTRFCAMSGTMTSRSILEYAHLIDLALGKNSPLPNRRGDLLEWSAALDVNVESPMPPGYLRLLCEEGEEVRDGYRRRLVQTPGVVATSEGSLGTSLVVRKRSPKVAPEVAELYRSVENTWSLDGEEFDSAMHLAKALKQISCGFYYVWDWPNGEKDVEWLEARSNWHKEVRERLKYSSEGMDSPLLLFNAAQRYHAGIRDGKAWASEHWPEWARVKDRWKPHPPKKTIWVSDFLVRDAIAWAAKHPRGIIWCQWVALAERISAVGNLPLYGAGADAGLATEPVIVCTTATQGTGKNLQHHYEHNLFTSLPPNGKDVEQILGRTHRPGQLADEVTVTWCAHTGVLASALDRVKEDARYMEKTTGQRQKILYATTVK